MIVLLRESNAASIAHLLSRQADPANAQSGHQELRDYGVGAQILKDLDVKDMILLSNSQPNIVGLDGYGLHITDWRRIAE